MYTWLQGKSRSATAVTAYIMASQGRSLQEALQIVQAQRKMAEPNPTFMARLKQFEKSDVLKQLQSQLWQLVLLLWQLMLFSMAIL